MKSVCYSILLVACLAMTQTSAQSVVNPVAGLDLMTDRDFKSIFYNDKLYTAEAGATYLKGYDGTTVTQYNYPAVGGEATRVYTQYQFKEPFVAFQSKLFVTLSNSSGQFLYNFNGSTFTSVALPGQPVSNPVVYNGQLYILTRSSTGLELLAYNGTTTSVAATYPLTDGFNMKLFSAASYLYVSYVDNATDYYTHVIRYDGLTSLMLPPLASLDVYEIVATPGTENILLCIPGYYMYHFDGVNLVTLVDEVGAFFSAMFSWNGALYFMEGYEPVLPGNLFKYESGVLSTIGLPDGANPVYGSVPVVYNNAIYIPAEFPDSSKGIYKYNGTTVTYFTGLSGLEDKIWTGIWLGVRNGNLLIIPDTDAGDYAYEYNSTTFTFTNITAPGGETIKNYLGSVGCWHAWTLHSASGYAVGREDAFTCAMAVIPSPLWNFNNVSIYPYAPDRDWCWTGIDIHWEIDPICPVPKLCPGPKFQVSLINKAGIVSWQKEFSKPFEASFGLPDKLAYTLVTSVSNDKGYTKVAELESSLVSQGITSVQFDMKPREKYFRLEVQTDKQEKIPFILALVNAKGKVIWKESFTAPLNKEITARVTEPGVLLRLLPETSIRKTCRDYGIYRIANYPNPARERLTVDIQSDESWQTPAEITLMNMNGTSVFSRKVDTAGQHHFELSGQKTGLYILKVSVGDVIKTSLVEVK
ncbi:MAG TPA: T9SS type A sorting domain-containing protein [Ohtaekwangia sp.]|uniref:T9SS type A sorting domain-containing protein n=1 Tax=Ohtaekwangia sp. TaxID=2066019 RepID=UPI002F9266F2